MYTFITLFRRSVIIHCPSWGVICNITSLQFASLVTKVTNDDHDDDGQDDDDNDDDDSDTETTETADELS